MAEEKEKQPTGAGKKVYTTVHPVRHDGKHRDPGSKIALTDKEAAPLLRTGYIKE